MYTVIGSIKFFPVATQIYNIYMYITTYKHNCIICIHTHTLINVLCNEKIKERNSLNIWQRCVDMSTVIISKWLTHALRLIHIHTHMYGCVKINNILHSGTNRLHIPKGFWSISCHFPLFFRSFKNRCFFSGRKQR